MRAAVGGDACDGNFCEKETYESWSFRGDPREIVKSVVSNESYSALMFNRKEHSADPWLSFTDHVPDIDDLANTSADTVLYGEGSSYDHNYYLKKGVNVFIRNSHACSDREFIGEVVLSRV